MKPFVLLLVSSLLLLYCKKDKKSVTELLTENTWHITQYQYRANTTDPWDIDPITDPCELDNIFTFLTSGNYTFTEGPTKCDPTDPDLIDTGLWALLNNDTTLRLTSGSDTIDFTIDQIDENSLMITYFDSSGPEYIRIVFTH